MRRNDVASTSFRRRVPTRFLINQCQIITFLILKYDIIRRRVPTRFLINQCQIITFLILKYDIIENSRIELRGIVLPVQVGGLLGGAKGYVGPPLKLLGGGAPPSSSYAYASSKSSEQTVWPFCLLRNISCKANHLVEGREILQFRVISHTP